MNKLKNIIGVIMLFAWASSMEACAPKNTTATIEPTTINHDGAADADPIPAGTATSTFTITAGAVVETLYFNTDSKTFKSAVDNYSKSVSNYGGELLAKFEVIKKKTERPVTHIAIVQWKDISSYAKAAKASSQLKNNLVDVSYYGAQQNTPVTLRGDKVYDFTSAFTIMTDPCQMPVVMGVMRTYFGKIGPVLQKYNISQTAFFGPHPGAPSTSLNTYMPHMMGIFQWNNVSDVAKFQSDKDFTDHVDVRDAVMQKMEYIYTKAIL